MNKNMSKCRSCGKKVKIVNGKFEAHFAKGTIMQCAGSYTFSS